MIITRDTFEKFKDAYLHALAITLKDSLSDCPKQKDDYLWNKLNELYHEPIDEEKLDMLAKNCAKNLGLSEDNEDFSLVYFAYGAGYREAMEE